MTKTKGALPLTLEEIARAKSLSALGRSYRAIGRELHRSSHAIKRVLTKSPEVIAEVKELKADLADLYEQRARETLEGVTAEDVKKASLQQKAISSGVFIDKARLLRDQSTSNLAVQVGVLLDAARLFRDAETDEEECRPARILPATPETPANQLPAGAGYSHTASRPAVAPHPQKTDDAPRVRYAPVRADRHPDHENEFVLMHGLRTK